CGVTLGCTCNERGWGSKWAKMHAFSPVLSQPTVTPHTEPAPKLLKTSAMCPKHSYRWGARGSCGVTLGCTCNERGWGSKWARLHAFSPVLSQPTVTPHTEPAPKLLKTAAMCPKHSPPRRAPELCGVTLGCTCNERGWGSKWA